MSNRVQRSSRTEPILSAPLLDWLAVVHLGGADGGVFLDDPADLAAYASLLDQLKALALSPARSALLLRQLTAA